MTKKLERLKREICHKGNLSEFENTVRGILVSIFESDCSISCCDTCETSSIEQATDGTFKTRIRESELGLKDKMRSQFITYGTFYMNLGTIYQVCLMVQREVLNVNQKHGAWDLGLEQLRKYPELFEHEDDYKKYREICLKTYE